MKLIYHDINNNNTVALKTNISGLFLDVIYKNNKELVSVTANNNNIEYTSLDITLKKIGKTNKRIMLNLIPSNTNNLELKEIYNVNSNYTDSLINIVNKYTYLNINIVSNDQPLLNTLRRSLIVYKLGWIVLNKIDPYIDIDIYIFKPDLLNVNMLLEQLSHNKEIMTYIDNENSLNTFKEFFLDINTNSKKKDIYMNISVITHNINYFL